MIMDNASIHHVENVVDLIENQIGARLLFLPSYSPDLNPVEEVFSQFKTTMKQNDTLFQSCTAPRVFLAMAFNMVTQDNCNSYITHAGYQSTICPYYTTHVHDNHLLHEQTYIMYKQCQFLNNY